MRQEREEENAALQYAAIFHCLVEDWKDSEELKPKRKEKWVDEKMEETKHRREWCAEANKYRCMKMWKRQQVHEDVKKTHRAEVLVRKRFRRP